MAKKNIKQGIKDVNNILNESISNAAAIKKVRALSSDLTFNLASFLGANYGDVMTGMQPKDWLVEAKTILKIVAKN